MFGRRPKVREADADVAADVAVEVSADAGAGDGVSTDMGIGAGAASTSASIADGDLWTAAALVVREAEETVQISWLAESARRFDQVRDGGRTASERCEAAFRRVVAAQLGGDPGQIVAAQVGLERALAALLRNPSAGDLTHLVTRLEAEAAPPTTVENSSAARTRLVRVRVWVIVTRVMVARLFSRPVPRRR